MIIKFLAQIKEIKEELNNNLKIQTSSKIDEYKNENSEKPKKRCCRKKMSEKQNMINFLFIILEENVNIL